MTNNLIVVHHGSAYGPEYVLNLWQASRRNSRTGFEFYVFTDNVKQHPQHLGWHFVKLPDYSSVNGFKPWWYKLEIFNSLNNIKGNNLYFDLDIVVVNNIDDFWDWQPTEFRICHDFNRAFNKHISYSNSSIMAWKDSGLSWIYEKFISNMQYTVRKYRGDQDYIHTELKDQLVWWPTEWAMSWKWEIKGGGMIHPRGEYKTNQLYVIPDKTKIIVCHGQPNPHEIIELRSFWHK
jgi:hypothetical protein